MFNNVNSLSRNHITKLNKIMHGTHDYSIYQTDTTISSADVLILFEVCLRNNIQQNIYSCRFNCNDHVVETGDITSFNS